MGTGKGVLAEVWVPYVSASFFAQESGTHPIIVQTWRVERRWLHSGSHSDVNWD